MAGSGLGLAGSGSGLGWGGEGGWGRRPIFRLNKHNNSNGGARETGPVKPSPPARAFSLSFFSLIFLSLSLSVSLSLFLSVSESCYFSSVVAVNVQLRHQNWLRGAMGGEGMDGGREGGGFRLAACLPAACRENTHTHARARSHTRAPVPCLISLTDLVGPLFLCLIDWSD